MTSFKDSQEAAFRRLMRGAVRKGGFSKAERDVVLSLLDHWFHHKPKGKMRPGRERIAKKAEVSVKTVQRVFAMLRDFGVMVPLSSLKLGRGKATEYRLDEVALLAMCGVDMAEIINAMTPRKRDICPTKGAAKRGTPCPTVYKDVGTEFPSQESENIIGFPKRAGGR